MSADPWHNYRQRFIGPPPRCAETLAWRRCERAQGHDGLHAEHGLLWNRTGVWEYVTWNER